jgi:hypothetical protein
VFQQRWKGLVHAHLSLQVAQSLNHGRELRGVTLTLEVIVSESQSLHLQLYSQHEGPDAMDLQRTITFLKFASVIVMGFGLLTAVAAWPPLNAPTRCLVGFGVLQWLVLTKLFAREPALARHMLLSCMWSWFVVDSTASVVAGAPFNAVMNVPFLMLFLVPLWRKVEQVRAR